MIRFSYYGLLALSQAAGISTQPLPLPSVTDSSAIAQVTGASTPHHMAASSATQAARVDGSPPRLAGSNARYYLSPGGRDSNTGTTSSTPWLTPNHALNCGDVIIAAASKSYSAINFGSGKWGAVTCPAGNNVTWLKCAAFDACKISVTSGTLDGMRVSASYWGVQGWEVSNTAGGSGGANCFTAVPANPTRSIHHIVFADNIAKTCPLGGLGFGNYGSASVDYWVAIGNIAYNAGGSNKYCGSGISAYQPVASDSSPGTHVYVAGNFSYSNTNPSGCYDGNGIIFDTFDGGQYPLPASYSQQGVIDNNIVLSNGGAGVRIEYNNAGAGPKHAHIFARHNTIWNNNVGRYQYGNPKCGELMLYKTVMTKVFLNIASTAQPGCYGDIANPAYAYQVETIDGTSSVEQNVGWSPKGFFSQATTSPGFGFGRDTFLAINPAFRNPMTPGAPNCGMFTSVTDCMATVIANFTPSSAAAVGYGYQVPGSAKIYDPLFPQWLCNVDLPAGLVTMGCATGPSGSGVNKSSRLSQ